MSVFHELEALGPPVAAVHGNVDEPAVRTLLTERLELEVEGARLGLIHDAGPAPDRLRRLHSWFTGCDAVIFGHSHIPLHAASGRFQIFNPGSPTDPRRQPRPTMGLAHIRDGLISFEIIPL
jgi:putative phosphoesterase